MNQKATLIEFLARLPNFDTVDERKAFISFSGFPHISIYLNLEGAALVFAERLINELSRRGRETLTKFMDIIRDAPQIGIERKEQLIAFHDAIQALDEPTWQAEFGVAAAAVEPAQAPHDDMLALTIVSTVLKPHFKKPEGPRRKAVIEIARRLDQVLSSDPGMADIWTEFKAAPEGLEKLIIPRVTRKLEADDALARELADLVDSATQPQAADERLTVDVFQELGVISAPVIGVALGTLPTEGIFTIVQKADEVKDTLIGFQAKNL
jgi:hypothetical protein